MSIAKPSRRGVSRRDVVVMLVVAALLLIVGLPLLNQRRSQARHLACKEHQRRLARAVLRYDSDHGRFPGGLHSGLPWQWRWGSGFSVRSRCLQASPS
jgi:type II secretory pathway pseudopilin PulG